MIDKNKAILIEKQPRKSGGPRTVYVFKCEFPKCENILKRRSADLKKDESQLLCLSHSHRKRPFESIYNGLFNDERGIKVELTYEEFLEFTKVKNCQYCDAKIPWRPYATINGKYLSSAYYLDRKDSMGPYSKENCVVCCPVCNAIKSNKFSYDEFRLIGLIIAQVYTNRKLAARYKEEGYVA